MLKLIIKLEKSKIFWSLLCITVGFFLLRLPSLFEPNWYGDEGIYQVIGRAINHGVPLYSGIWDNKPPLLYLTYALFNGDQFSVRLASLIVGVISMWTFFFLSQKLFEKVKISIIVTSIFALLFAAPIIEGNIANAENFMLLPIILAGLLFYKTTQIKDPLRNEASQKLITKKLFIAGLLLGIAFLFKIVAIFDLAAFLLFFMIVNLPPKFKQIWEKETFKKLVTEKLVILSGFILPVLLTVLYFLFNKAIIDFVRATFLGNVGYVGYGNSFIIPQGLLIIKLILLAVLVLFLIVKRNKIYHPTLFIVLWSGFSLFNALFSQRPYTHYVLVMLPSFCLLIGLILHEKNVKLKQTLLILLLVVVASLFATFKFYNLQKTLISYPLRYYQNAFLFVTGKRDVLAYQSFFDPKTPRDYDLAAYLKMHLKPNDRVFIWGDSAQIYILSDTLPINKYTVAYHISQSRAGFEDTQAALMKVGPKYVIVLPEAKAFPFKLPNYVSRFSISHATIYERSF